MRKQGPAWDAACVDDQPDTVVSAGLSRIQLFALCLVGMFGYTIIGIYRESPRAPSHFVRSVHDTPYIDHSSEQDDAAAPAATTPAPADTAAAADVVADADANAASDADDGTSQIVVPRPQPEPTIDRPFFFFHVPKCGGSTYRAAIDAAAKARGKSSFIPCHNGIGCQIGPKAIADAAAAAHYLHSNHSTNLGTDAACAHAFAGHFSTGLVPFLSRLDHNYSTTQRQQPDTEEKAGLPPSRQRQCHRGWGEWNEEGDVNNVTSTTGLPTFDCFVSLRQPVSRFVSHYYHFVESTVPEYKGRPLKELSYDEIKYVLHRFGGGNISVSYLSNYVAYGSNRTIGWGEKVEGAKNLLSRCIVGITEDSRATDDLTEAAFPWLRGFVKTQARINVGGDGTPTIHHETKDDFKPEILAMIQSSLQAEYDLYLYGLEVFDAQLRHYNIKRTTT